MAKKMVAIRVDIERWNKVWKELKMDALSQDKHAGDLLLEILEEIYGS